MIDNVHPSAQCSLWTRYAKPAFLSLSLSLSAQQNTNATQQVLSYEETNPHRKTHTASKIHWRNKKCWMSNLICIERWCWCIFFYVQTPYLDTKGVLFASTIFFLISACDVWFHLLSLPYCSPIRTYHQCKCWSQNSKIPKTINANLAKIYYQLANDKKTSVHSHLTKKLIAHEQDIILFQTTSV